MRSTKTAPTTIDEYLDRLSDDKRKALQRIREIIHSAVPAAEECISYQLPGFRLDDRMLIWFGAGANHCAIYPGALSAAFEKDLAAYSTSKGTIRFDPDTPFPAALLRKLIKAKIAQNREREKLRAAKKKSRKR